MFNELVSPLYGLSEEELLRLIEESKEKFEQSHLRLIELCSFFDRVKLITSFYLSTLVRPLAHTYEPGFPISYIHSEIVHVCALVRANTTVSKTAGKNHIEELFEIMAHYFDSYELMNHKHIPGLDQARELKALRSYMHKMITKYRRNWGFFDDVKEIMQELIDRVGSGIKQSCGINLLVLKALLNIIYDRSARIESVVNNALIYFPDSEDTHVDLFKYFYLGNEGETIVQLFTISISEVSDAAGVSLGDAEKVLSQISFGLAAENFLKVDMVLGNPIWKKPFINLGDGKYLFSGVHIFPTNIIPIIDFLLKDHKNAKKNWEYGFQTYLEDKAYSVLTERYPGSTVLKKYYVGGKKGHISEKDILFKSSDFLALLECKAIKYKDDASRGEWDRLGRHYEFGQIKAKSQVNEAYQQIFSSSGEVFIEGEDKSICFDSSTIHRVSRIVLIPYDFGLANGMPVLDVGWEEVEGEDVLVMGLSDLMIITEILDSEAEFVDYLVRRSEVAKKIKFLSEETEFLAQYLKNRMRHDSSLYAFVEKSKQLFLFPIGRDEIIAAYKNEKYLGRLLRVPRVETSNLWLNIIGKLNGSKKEQFHKVCGMLFDFSYEDQLEIESTIGKYYSMLSRFGVERELYCFGYDCAFYDARVMFAVHYGNWNQSKQAQLKKFIMGYYADEVGNLLIIQVNVKSAYDSYETIMLMKKRQ